MQNVREYIKVKLHTTADSALKAVAKPTFKCYSIVDENLVQTNHFLPAIHHNTPIAIGVTILELSKLVMFDAWYNKLTKNSGCSFDLGMTDTDSFLFKVSNAKKFFNHFNEYMDYSNYPKSHPLYSDDNKAQLGYFKDELCGTLTCNEFVGLRSKCYALSLEDKSDASKVIEKKICKGIGRTAIKNRLKFDHYKSCLFQKKTYRQDFHSIRSVNHNLATVRIKKQALNYLDTKRWIFDCGIHSVPFGSFVIKKNKGKCPRCQNYFYSV